ncbi:MAG: hypothetical protein K0R18_1500 [Bacillales bacterium]|jgi:N-acetylmuramoyl-L-alanine amidase|nr:hypothetical protein [Bacillales bacterium]
MFNRFTKFVINNKIILATIAVIAISATVAVFVTYPSLLNKKTSSQNNALGNKKNPEKEPSDKIVIAEKKYEIRLNGGDITLQVKDPYVEPGASVTINAYPISNPCTIEGTVDVTKPGIYEISYSYKNAKVIRKVTIADQIKPVIQLKGSSKMVLTVNDKFTEPGFSASDNLDGDLTAKVTITGTVNTAKAGKYTITYSVKDSSGNTTSINRDINIIKKIVVIQAPVEEKPAVPQYTPSMNQVGKLSFTGSGFSISGLSDIANMQLAIFDTLTNTEIQKTPASVSGNTFQSNINLGSLQNGSYELMVFNGSEYKTCVDNIPTESKKIRRAKVGDKLITMSYPSNRVCFQVENYVYLYDVCINVGHGGTDPGAVLKDDSGKVIFKEADFNLEVSLYEKKRYEEHGLKVYLNRTFDTYGALLGNLDLLRGELKISDVKLPQSAINHGFYGSVSKVTYSNHNNSSANTNASGWEILVQMSATADQLAPELKIANGLDALFGKTGRFYTKDYDTNVVYNKRNGSVYSFKENYAMNRYALELFNVKTVIYEGCYISNPTEFNWYYNGGNWKKASEIKIKNYVESIGVSYIPPVQ